MNLENNLVRELIPNAQGSTFGYKHEDSIWPVWHYHSEIDILLFVDSSGQHITGDYIGSFGPGTLLVNGPNVPHAFTSDPRPNKQSADPAIIVLQFSEESIGRELLSKPEMKFIRDFIQSTSRSFEFFGQTRDTASQILQDIQHSQNAQRICMLLSLLETLALAPADDKRSLVSELYCPVLSEKNIKRIETIRTWVLQHLTEKMSVEEAAAQIKMPPKSFAYFFKKNTGKTFVQYVKELRIGLACQRLLNTELNILEICYMSGYNNLSNFNRQFMEVKSMTPTTFRQKLKRLTKSKGHF